MYFTTDKLWEAYGIKNKEEHLLKNVVYGKFHNDVPKDILKSYLTVEYLMAHSYYHWQMYDEALKKIVGIFEMAIRIKCKLVGITTKHKSNKGKLIPKSLSVLINEVLKDYNLKDLKISLNNLREVRNHFAHPDSHGFIGASAKPSIVSILNLLNQLFLPMQILQEEERRFKKIEQKSKSLIDKILVFEYNKVRILVTNPIPIRTIKTNDTWVNIWRFEPILNNTKQVLEDHIISKPILVPLIKENVNKTGLKAINYENEQEIELHIDNNPLNIEKFNNYILELNNSSEIDLDIFNSNQYHQYMQFTNYFSYNNCWNSDHCSIEK